MILHHNLIVFYSGPSGVTGRPFALGGLGVLFLGEAVGEFEGGDEAGLLVQAAEVTG